MTFKFQKMLVKAIVKFCTTFYVFILCLNIGQAQSGMIDIDYRIDNPTACNQLDGAIHITPINGIAPFEYSINGGASFQSDSSFTNLGIGTYILLIRDAERKFSSFILAKLQADGSPVIRGIVMADPMECGKGGMLKILTEGGFGLLEYSIDSGRTFQPNFIFTDVPSGSYHVIVRNEGGSCPASYPPISFAPQSPSNFITVTTEIDHPDCDTTNGAITVMVTGGSGDYLYSINDGETYQTSNVFDDLGDGTYAVLVRDTISNCEKGANQITTLVEENCRNCTDLVISYTKIDPACDTATGEIIVTATGGSGNYSYSINNDTTFQNASNFLDLAAGAYTISVRDIDYDCEKSGLETVNLNPANCPNCDSITLQSFVTFPTCDLLNGRIELAVAGGSGDYSVSVNEGEFQSTLSLDSLGGGTYIITVRDNVMGCEKTFSAIDLTATDCACSLNLFTDKNLSTMAPTCESMASLCLDVSLTTLMKLEVSDNGAAYAGGLAGCAIDTMLTYLYFTLPGQGLAGPYRLDRWELNDSIYTGTFQDIHELVEMMNRLDPAANWERDAASMTLKGGFPGNTYGALEITQLATDMMGVMQLNTNFLPRNSQISLTTGQHELIFKDPTSNCSDTIQVMVDCPACPQIAVVGGGMVSLSDCEELASFCFTGADSLDLSAYTITDNGTNYTGDIRNCTDLLLGFELSLNTGQHELIFRDTTSNCSDTIQVRIDCPTCPQIAALGSGMVQTSNCDEPALVCFTGADSLDLSTYSIIDNGMNYTGVIRNCSNLLLGFELLLDTGRHQIIFENNAIDCRFVFNLTVTCQTNALQIDTIIIVGETDTICFADYLMNDNITSIGPTCEGQNPSVGFEVNNLTNCLIYEGLMVGVDTLCLSVCENNNSCEEITIIVTVLDSMMVDTMTMDTMTMDTVCQSIFSEKSASIQLTDCTTEGQYCLSLLKSDLTAYSFFINDSLFTGTFADCDLPEHASLSLPIGNYQLILTENDGLCSDTAMLMITCEEEMDIFEDTILVNETDTLCLDSLDLPYTIASIANVCEEDAGERVIFELDTINYCLIYTGIEVGTETACIVTCDSLDNCDTVLIVITVEELPDTIPPPIAVDDSDTLTEGSTKTINVLGNDTTNSTLITLVILEQPTNGIATVNADLTVNYMANEGLCDTTDMFTYELCNPSGCDTATVTFYIECKAFLIFNGFSPNGDNVNETFTIEGIEDFPNNNVQVFNRWGNMVFEQNGYKGQWNGTWNNKDLPNGTYFYLLNDGEGKQYSGFLEIRR